MRPRSAPVVDSFKPGRTEAGQASRPPSARRVDQAAAFAVATSSARPAAPTVPSVGDGLRADGAVTPAVEARIDARRAMGAPLAPAVCARATARLADPLADARIHTDDTAADLARAVAARAFTVGADIFFAAGEYRPGTARGDRLIAHEAAHSIQQRGAPRARPLRLTEPEASSERDARAGGPQHATGEQRLAREPWRPEYGPAGPPNLEDYKSVQPRWGSAYATTAARPSPITRQGFPYEYFKSHIGANDAAGYAPAIIAASTRGGTKLTRIALTLDELADIVKPEGGGHADANKARLAPFLGHINTAFEALGIDTVEAQCSYLAHAAESGSFALMSEELISTRTYDYPPEFKGRGPVQVTFKHGYVQAIAYLEKRADELDHEAGAAVADPATASHLKDLAIAARRAAEAIMRDPGAAAEPRYAFLFSAAFMHNMFGVTASASLKGRRTPAFAGNGPEDRWVTGWKETFDDGLRLAGPRTSATELDKSAALARLAAASGDAAALKKAAEDLKAANAEISRQVGVVRDVPDLKLRALVKQGIFVRAFDVLTKRNVQESVTVP